MSLNPSCNTVAGKPLPVLGDPPFSQESAAVAMEELRSCIEPSELLFENETRRVQVFKEGSKGFRNSRAGIQFHYDGIENDIEEVERISVRGVAFGWTFRRAWYYWVCSTKKAPVPQNVAQKLNNEWGSQVRVDGYAGGKSVTCKVYSYHVDTFEGLQVLLAAIQEANQREAI